MLPCRGCGYRREIPGDSHLRCAYRWDLDPAKIDALLAGGLEAALNNRKTGRWFRWPFNFDPLWGPDACPARAEQADPAMALEDNPRTHLLSFLARRL
jgi:hypothetical protein